MWTYDPTNLDETTPEGRKNIVRFLVGDTDEIDQQLQDEEILFSLDSNNDKLYGAAISVVSAIISKYARLVNVELDEAIKEDYSDLVDNYIRLRKELGQKSKFNNGSITLVATGLTVDDFYDAAADPNRVRPGIEQFRWRDWPYDLSYDRYKTITG